MKTILVPTGGSDTDQAVFTTALAAARPLGAHLEFLHVRLGAGDAAPFVPHVDFARGAALRAALQKIDADQERRLTIARRHFERFCEANDVPLRDVPGRANGISATWRQALEGGMERIMIEARHNDLIVTARAAHANGLPQDFVELALVGSGRPILLAPWRSVERLTGTALVCWKETPQAARALAAALPLLARSKRVIILTIEEQKDASLENGVEMARQLAWQGIAAKARWMPADRRGVAAQIDAAASEHEADLIVMGGYGHGRVRELVFGGCTQHFLEGADRPVLLMH
ncbi:MAG TPA: universal stress protein [Stellaceae bacterium]|nr:universal stress protein [Stellaceae bacterium]